MLFLFENMNYVLSLTICSEYGIEPINLLRTPFCVISATQPGVSSENRMKRMYM